MDRRAFFRTGLNKASKVAVQEIDERVNARAAQWIRPPYALEEFDFLLACTRCDKCIEACPYQVIFSLSARLGAQVAGTPALDLLNKGCQVCNDWPCVKACEPKALKLPEAKDAARHSLPNIAVAEINTQTCLPYSGPECGACAHRCPVPGAILWNDSKPMIDQDKCNGCVLLREDCIVEPKAIGIKSIYRAYPDAGTDTQVALMK